MGENKAICQPFVHTMLLFCRGGVARHLNAVPVLLIATHLKAVRRHNFERLVWLDSEGLSY